MKVAKYAGTDKTDLIENVEFGYCSIIKATHSILDKLDVENKTFVKITGAAERLQKQMIDKTALREAFINAIVHNDYTSEVPPVVEIYADRLTITSYGGLVNGLNKDEFFAGRSMPRNRELMRVYRDLRLVEQLGSGIHRILKAYDKSIFKMSANFLEISFPFEKDYESNQVGNQVGNQVDSEKSPFFISDEISQALLEAFINKTKPSEKQIEKYKPIVEQLTNEQKEILRFSETPKKKKEILVDCLGLTNQTKNFITHVEPLIKLALMQRTLPDVPKSQFQRYVNTSKGKVVLYLLDNN